MYQLVDRLTSEVQVDDGIDIELVFLWTLGEALQVLADAFELGEKLCACLHECSRNQTAVRSLDGRACCARHTPDRHPSPVILEYAVVDLRSPLSARRIVDT